MATAGGANTVVDGLVFGYDTGYPLVSGSSDTYKFNRGEPTENLVGNPTFIGTSGTQTQGVTPADWVFSGESGPNGFKFYDSSSSPIPLKFPNEGSVITINSGSQNRRIYFRRTDLLPNTTYTISCWMYFSGSFQSAWSKFQYDSNGTGVGGGYFDNFENYASANGHGLEEWFLWEGTLTTEATTAQSFWGPVISKGYKILVGLQRLKVEVKDHRTPFTTGTRSVSGSLIDLTRTTDIHLSNVSFDSNAQMTFDGTDDYAEVPSFYVPTGSRTVEVVIRTSAEDSNSTQKHIFSNSDQPGNNIDDKGIAFLYRYGKIMVYIIGYDPNASPIAPRTALTFINSPEVGKYYHLVLTHDDLVARGYTNGVLTTSGDCVGSRLPSNDTTIGRYSPGYGSGFNGDIPLVRVYNKVLTPQEVQQNYNALKERFSL